MSDYNGMLELLAAQGDGLRHLNDRMTSYEDVIKLRQDATDIMVLQLRQRVAELERVVGLLETAGYSNEDDDPEGWVSYNAEQALKYGGGLGDDQSVD
jgi:hypothetical protein